MGTIHSVFNISEIIYCKPKMPSAPTLPPITDILIGVTVLFGTVGCVIVFRILYRKWKNRIYRRTPSDLLYPINPICSVRSPCLTLLTLSENFESS